MNCENYLCIYESNGKCTLKTISLDISGQCTNCIYVTLTEEEVAPCEISQGASCFDFSGVFALRKLSLPIHYSLLLFTSTIYFLNVF